MEKKKTANLNTVVKGQRKITTVKKDDPCNFKELKSVSQGCINLFNGKKLSNSDFVKMFETIRSISNTEVGLTYLLSKNYEEAILRRGMIILREDVKEKPGHSYLVKLGEIWTNFYQNILPTLQVLFGSIPTHGMTVKQMTVVSFRDIVVLKLKMEEALSANDQAVPKSVKQMFCILLQSSHDNSDNYLKLESLAARVINPLLGMKGLYVRSEVKEQHADKKTNDRFITSASVVSSVENSPETQAKADHDADADFEELMNFRRQKFNRYGGGGGPQRLSCVDENKEGISESLASLIADGFELG